ncbi:polyunsaturated fatty acid 5-lipoxygenase-like [Diadema setosum]|uniref:polyunsaturated fatty acid 5-lipoxygenase-like n=1 Tax=Diadema setosum TaxID=31175 RepID=UPI003B3A3A31
MGAALFSRQNGIHYLVVVKTGDRLGVGTNSDVYIAFHDKIGHRTRDITLNNPMRNDFERGHADEFDVDIEDKDFREPEFIEIWRDGQLFDDEWYCEFVRVHCLQTRREHVFPVHRWVSSTTRLTLREYDMVLPQHDSMKDQRTKELRQKRMIYQTVRHKQTSMLLLNFASNVVKLKVATNLIDITTDCFTSLEDVKSIYRPPLLPVPTGMHNWRSDKEFGYQRLKGVNPTQIRLCTKIPDNFAVTESDLRPLLEGMTIVEATSKKRLFIVDYGFLRDLPCTGNRSICAPMALFFVNTDKNLLPVAIQLFPDPAPDNPVFYPSDPEYTWLLAKCYFNNADASVHESANHLGFTHLVGESVVVATKRCLSPSLPVYRLFAPHFLYLIAINKFAVESLINEGGWVDRAMVIGRIGLFEIIKRTWATWRLDVQGSLLGDLEERGVADPEVLPNYHYRDDALLMRGAIFDYVKRVIDYVYDSPEKIEEDHELQEWGRFLGGNPVNENEAVVGMKGLPNDGHFKTTFEVTDTLTNFIFICSVGHAAANFGQYDQYAFPPNYPAWLHGEPPRDKTPLTADDLIDQLPDKQETLEVMTVTKILSTRATKSLGDFETCYMFDPEAQTAIQRFRADLQAIGQVIDERNDSREERNEFIHPREVPNSINI